MDHFSPELAVCGLDRTQIMLQTLVNLAYATWKCAFSKCFDVALQKYSSMSKMLALLHLCMFVRHIFRFSSKKGWGTYSGSAMTASTVMIFPNLFPASLIILANAPIWNTVRFYCKFTINLAFTICINAPFRRRRHQYSRHAEKRAINEFKVKSLLFTQPIKFIIKL